MLDGRTFEHFADHVRWALPATRDTSRHELGEQAERHELYTGKHQQDDKKQDGRSAIDC
jgi:hypothetical protein